MSLKKKILVVDDDPVIRDVFKIILEAAGYEVELTGDGKEVLKNQFSTPHLFLIDKFLSGVNGLDLCKHLKAQLPTKNIPVIMISASPGLATQSAKVGADDWIENHSIAATC
jgi:CheY-like chemotaxis protein